MKLIKTLTLALVAVLAGDSYAGTCTSISFTNKLANSILTSSEYNNAFNTVYNSSNAYDAGCITSGTLEYDALNTTQFAPVLNGVREGCKVTNTDGNTISVDRCMLSVNGLFVKTATATTATWGCSGCSAEVASTLYYVYVATGSTGSTLTLKILTGAPNGDGYDASGNRVIGKFYNNASSAIQGVEQWADGSFVAPRSMVWLETGNGHGSGSTKIRRYTTVHSYFGTDITYTDSGTLGAVFTINADGLYAMSITDNGNTGGMTQVGISLNSAQLTTNILSLTTANRICMATPGDNVPAGCSATVFLSSGDVIRPHTDGANPREAVNHFQITKVSP